MTTIEQIDNGITVSREELYRQVWQEPMTKVAPRYGLSDVGLAKVYRKYQIPRPPVGYWAKFGVGQHVEQTPLPTLDDESLQEIQFFRQQFFGDLTDAPKRLVEKVKVVVSDRLIGPHPLVAKTREHWPTKKSVGEGEDQKMEHCLSVHVSAQAFPRAMRIYDALIKKWEELGGSVRVDPTRFVFDDDSVGVSLSEEMDRVEKNKDENRYWKDWEYKHTGRLVLEISGRWERNFRKHWGDGKKQQLENILGSFIEGLRKWIANERAHRLEDEIRERQRSKALQVHTRREELAKKFAQQAKHLEQCAANFAQSEEIRKYLETFESKIDQGLIRPTNPETFPGWLEWAKWYADYLDPLTPTPMREDYSVLPKNMPVADLEWTERAQVIIETLGVTDTDELYRVDRQTVINIGNRYNSSEWSEIGRVLEGLGYDVSDNRYKY